MFSNELFMCTVSGYVWVELVSTQLRRSPRISGGRHPSLAVTTHLRRSPIFYDIALPPARAIRSLWIGAFNGETRPESGAV
jgi:hypothetical protein